MFKSDFYKTDVVFVNIESFCCIFTLSIFVMHEGYVIWALTTN